MLQRCVLDQVVQEEFETFTADHITGKIERLQPLGRLYNVLDSVHTVVSDGVVAKVQLLYLLGVNSVLQGKHRVDSQSQGVQVEYT